MATFFLSVADYHRAQGRKSRVYKDAYAGLFLEVVKAFSRHLPALAGSRLTVLYYLANRTLRFNKAGQFIIASQFHEDVINEKTGEVYSGPLGLSDNTREKAVRELADLNFLHIFRCEHTPAKLAPIYEINCKALLGYAVKDEKTDMPILPEPRKKQKNAAVSEEKCYPEIGGIAPQKLGTKTSVNKPGKKELILSAARSAPADGRLTAREKAEQIIAASRARRAERVASGAAKPADKITREEMQAMVDQTMRTYYPSLPRVCVTAKDFGMLRAKIRQSQSVPPQMGTFIEYVITNWATLYQQNTKAARRKAQNGDTRALQGIMPSAFAFGAFAVRYSWFLTCFTSARLAPGMAQATTSEEQTALAKTQARLKRTEQELANTQQALVRQRRATATRPTHTSTTQAPPARRMGHPVTQAARTLDLPVTAEEDALLRGLDDLIQGDTRHAQR